VFKFLDAYSLRARLFPAILGAAPALAALALLVSWQHVHMSNIIASITLFVLVFALADFARKLGVAVEPKIYAEMGGKPSVTMFHRSDTTIEGSHERPLSHFHRRANQSGGPVVAAGISQSGCGPMPSMRRAAHGCIRTRAMPRNSR